MQKQQQQFIAFPITNGIARRKKRQKKKKKVQK